MSPLLGLPALDVLDRPDTSVDRIGMVRPALEDPRALVDRAAGRPFIWVDDEIGTGDREWVAANHAGRALLHRVDARTGLRPVAFTEFADWLANPAR